jgi:hypothetical protein
MYRIILRAGLLVGWGMSRDSAMPPGQGFLWKENEDGFVVELKWCLYLPLPLLTKEGEWRWMPAGESVERNESGGLIQANFVCIHHGSLRNAPRCLPRLLKEFPGEEDYGWGW